MTTRRTHGAFPLLLTWAAGALTFACLVLAIVQVGPNIVMVPVIIWAWTAMDTTTALLFTPYMIPVNLIDNVLRPLVMGRGLDTRSSSS